MKKYFVYCNNYGFDEFETEKEARDNAYDRIQDYLDGTWDEEVESVCWGEIKEIAKQCNVVQKQNLTDEQIEEHGYDHSIDCEYYCNYKLKPVS